MGWYRHMIENYFISIDKGNHEAFLIHIMFKIICLDRTANI